MYKPMTMLGAGCILLALAACGKGKEEEDASQGADMPMTEDQQKADVEQLQCNPDTMLGTVALQMAGNPGDSFRITFLCDGQQVAQCTAIVSAGAIAARCNAQGAVPRGGTRSCPVGPGNANSPAARVIASGCG